MTIIFHLTGIRHCPPRLGGPTSATGHLQRYLAPLLVIAHFTTVALGTVLLFLVYLFVGLGTVLLFWVYLFVGLGTVLLFFVFFCVGLGQVLCFLVILESD